MNLYVVAFILVLVALSLVASFWTESEFAAVIAIIDMGFGVAGLFTVEPPTGINLVAVIVPLVVFFVAQAISRRLAARPKPRRASYSNW
jgi:hypothetical protein